MNPTIERLEDQIAWYDRMGRVSYKRYFASRMITIMSASLILIAGSLHFNFGAWIDSLLAMTIIFVQLLETVQQYQANSISYRSTAESLKHEKYLYLGMAGPYATSQNPSALLAERTESLVSREHAAWGTTRVVDKAVLSSQGEKELRTTSESVLPDHNIPPELVDHIFKTLKSGRLSGWEIAKSVQGDPQTVSGCLNFLKSRGLIESTGPGLEGYYYLTSAGFSLQGLTV
jgi:hypothetical protein